MNMLYFTLSSSSIRATDTAGFKPFTMLRSLGRQSERLANNYISSVSTVRRIRQGKLPFLDCLVSRDNNELRTTVYRKPTHTDRLLDESSYNPTSHKATTIETLTRPAQLVCDTPNSIRDENSYLERVFHKNNYNADFIRRNIYRPTEADATSRNPTPITTVTIPYIKALLRLSHGSYSPTTSV